MPRYEKPPMRARDIDSNGVWNAGRYQVPLLGCDLPLPEEVGAEDESERVLFMTWAADFISDCPSCDLPLLGWTIMIHTKSAQMMPTHCCDRIHWYSTEGNEILSEYE